MTGASDLGDRTEAAITAYLLEKLPEDSSGELASKSMRELLTIYANWRSRNPMVRPRQVHISAEMAAAEYAGDLQADLDALITKLRTGQSIGPHLSRQSAVAYVPTGQRTGRRRDRREFDLDRLRADAGIHHLHLSQKIEPDGFVARTGQLLFAIFVPDDAYLIGIYEHGDWYHDDLAPIIISNWPGVGPYFQLNYAQVSSAALTPTERKQRRRASLSGEGIVVDGKSYVSLGQTDAGMALLHQQPIMAIGEHIRRLRDDPEPYLAALLRDWEKQLGHEIPAIGSR